MWCLWVRVITIAIALSQPMLLNVAKPTNTHPVMPTFNQKHVLGVEATAVTGNSENALKIFSANCNGFKSKKALLSAELIKNKIDVACIQESKLGKLDTGITTHIENFTTVRADRNANGGGVLMLIREGVNFYRLDSIESCDALEAIGVVAMGKNAKKTVIICVYRPPARTTVKINKFIIEICKILDTIKMLLPKASVVVTGDMNINSLVPAEKSIIDSICDEHNLKQNVTDVTHHMSCIDHLLVSKETTVESVLGPTLEKKKTNEGHATITAKICEYGIITRPKQEVRERQMWHRTNWEAMGIQLQEIGLTKLVSEASSLEEAVDRFTKTCLEVIHQFVPVKKSKTKYGKQPQWWDQEILPLLKNRDAFYRLKIKNPDIEEYKSKFQAARVKARKALAKAKAKYIIDGFANVNNSADFYKAVNKLFKKPKETIPPLRTQEGGILTDAKEKAEAINKQCATKWPQIPAEHKPRQFNSDLEFPPDYECTNEWTNDQLRKLKEKKATGDDQIPTLFLKRMAPNLFEPLTIIINRSLREGKFPNTWKHAIIVPIGKIPSPKSAEDFRPLAILPIISKITERYVKMLIEQVKPNVIPLFQYSYECKVGTIEAVQHLMLGIGRSMKLCKAGKKTTATNVSVVATDISRAFDGIPHSVVVNTLADSSGLPNYITRWVQDFLTNRTQKVRVNDQFSSKIEVKAGVIQGSVLGPILFNHVVAGLKNIKLAPTTTIVEYADDVVLVGPTQDKQQLNTLQENVNQVIQYFNGVGLQINENKSQHLVVTVNPAGAKDFGPIEVNGKPIKRVETLKYLGLHLDSRLTMKAHVDKVTQRARGMLYQVRAELQRNNCRSAINIIYTSCIRPIMTYAISIYYPNTVYLQNKLERVDKTAARMITNNYDYNIHGAQLMNDLNWPTLKQLSEAEQVSNFWQYVNKIKRTPGGEEVIIEDVSRPKSSRLRARQEDNAPKHKKYTVTGVPEYDNSARFNVPLVTAAYRFNITPDSVFVNARTARGVKVAFLANSRADAADGGLLRNDTESGGTK
jgi:hypothetical protein